MKKLFLAICFILISATSLNAKVKEVLDKSQIPEPVAGNTAKSTQIKQVSPTELEKFLTDRLQKTVVKNPREVKSNNIFVEPSDLARKAAEEAQKGTFQRIYESAMQRVSNGEKPEQQRADVVKPEFMTSVEQQKQEWEAPDFPVIDITLPGGRKAMVPATEHIPYLMNGIEILPDGMVIFNETVVTVANGQKLKNGLTKILPKYIYSRNGETQKLSYAILSVDINGQEIPYKILEGIDNVLFVPQNEFNLEPGVYNYNFKYAVDNVLWDYGDFKEFYWDISGSYWNLVIAQSGATLTLPPGVAPLGQEVYIGSPLNLSADGVKSLHPSENTWGYAAQRAMFIGEGLHLIVSLPEDAVMPPTLFKRLTRIFDANGDIIIALLTLIMVLGSFIVSWHFIRAEKRLQKFSFPKNAAMMRFLLFNRYDLKSFASFLLDMYRKNIIDIQHAGETVLAVKRTDNLKNLSSAEQKALKQLFGNNEAVFNIHKNNMLKIRRAAQILEKEIKFRLRAFIFKLNGGYLFFSSCMLLCGELFISFLSTSPLQNFTILALTTLVMAAGIIIFRITPDKLWQNILYKAAGSLITAGAFVVMSALLSLSAVIIIMAILIIIACYMGIYGQRNGLLKPHIKEAAGLKEYLLKHHDNIILGREIANQQPYILALDMEEQFACKNNEYDKLGAVTEAIKKLGRK